MKSKRRNNNSRSGYSIWFPIITIIGIGVLSAFTSNYREQWFYNWDGIRESIKDSILVYEYRSITSGIGGMGRSTEKEVESRKWVMEYASVNELDKLTKFPRGTIKAIAYEGLHQKKEYLNKTELVLKAINDTIHKVSYQSGCIGWEMEIGEYLVNYVLNVNNEFPPLPPGQAYKHNLSNDDIKIILSEFKKRPKSLF